MNLVEEPVLEVVEDGEPLRPPTGPPQPPRPPLPPIPAIVVRALVCVSLVAGSVLIYAVGISSLQESRSQHLLYAQLREQLAEATAPLGGTIESGSPVLVLDVPRAGLRDVVVVEGTTSGDLQLGPGHRRDTPLPGQPGVSILMGRSVTFGRPFEGLPGLRPGDVVTATTAQGVFSYRVDDVRRAGDPLPPALAAGASRLLLVSSEGSGWRSGWAPSQLVFVDASLQGQAQPAPPGRAAATTAAEQVKAGDLGSLMPLVLWLQALLLVSVALVWARARWGSWQTWLVGLPLVLAVVWASIQSAVQLLPNLL
jgi:sortase A